VQNNEEHMQFGYFLKPNAIMDNDRAKRHHELQVDDLKARGNHLLGEHASETVAERTALFCAAFTSMEQSRRARFDLSTRFVFLIFQIVGAAAAIKLIDRDTDLVAIALVAAIVASVFWSFLARAARANFEMKMQAVRELERFVPLKPVTAEAAWLKLEDYQWTLHDVGSECWPLPAAYRKKEDDAWVPVNLRRHGRKGGLTRDILRAWCQSGPTDEQAACDLVDKIVRTLKNRDHRYDSVEIWMPWLMALAACLLLLFIVQT